MSSEHERSPMSETTYPTITAFFCWEHESIIDRKPRSSMAQNETCDLMRYAEAMGWETYGCQPVATVIIKPVPIGDNMKKLIFNDNESSFSVQASGSSDPSLRLRLECKIGKAVAVVRRADVVDIIEMLQQAVDEMPTPPKFKVGNIVLRLLDGKGYKVTKIGPAVGEFEAVTLLGLESDLIRDEEDYELVTWGES